MSWQELITTIATGLISVLMSFGIGWFFAKKSDKKTSKQNKIMIKYLEDKLNNVAGLIASSSTSDLLISTGARTKMLKSGLVEDLKVLFTIEYRRLKYIDNLMNEEINKNTLIIDNENWHEGHMFFKELSNYWTIISMKEKYVTKKRVDQMPKNYNYTWIENISIFDVVNN